MLEANFSVIMSVFNSEIFLSEAIESILNQTLTNFEFIIIDDGSTDNSSSIIQNYARKDPRIKLVENNINIGLARSLNKGIELANGKYIARMDADDISIPNRFEKQYHYLENNQNIYVVGSNYKNIDENGNQKQQSEKLESPNQIRWGLFFSNQMAHPTVMMRTDLFKKYGYFYNPFPYTQDYDLWIRISEKFDLSNLSDNLLFYRDHKNKISNKYKSEQRNLDIDITIDHIKKTTLRELNYDQIKGLKNPRNIKSIEDAVMICSLLIKIQSISQNWCLNKTDRNFINGMTFRKIKEIFYSNNFSIKLLPYFFHSIYKKLN